MPNARTSANYDAFSTYLNVNGLSHGKIANTNCDALKHDIHRLFKIVPQQDSHKQGIGIGSRLN